MLKEMEKSDRFNFRFIHYLHFLEIAVLNPNQYAKFLKSLSLKKALVFFILNASLWLILATAIQSITQNPTTLPQSHRSSFLAILLENSILVLVIFMLVILLAIFLHILAKFFGSWSKTKTNFKAVLFSTILLPFFAIPFFKVLAGIISFYILVYNYQNVNRFDKIRAIIPVIIPIGILGFALFSMGVLNIQFLIR